MMMSPRVYIIIVNYLRWQDSADCARSLLASTSNNYTIIIVDNASGNRSLEQIAAELEDEVSSMLIQDVDWEKVFRENTMPRLVLIQHAINGGFAAANNIALKPLLQEDAYAWLLNPDMVVEPGTLAQLAGFAGQQSGHRITGATVRSFHNLDKVLFYGGGRVHEATGTIRMIDRKADLPRLEYISGASIFVHCSVLNSVGLLPEHYFLYWEETDWCHRAGLQGVPLAVCTEAVCYDKISTVIGNGFLAHYYYTRNGLYFVAKYHPQKLKQALLAARLRYWKRILRGQWTQAKGLKRGVRDFLKNKSHAIDQL